MSLKTANHRYQAIAAHLAGDMAKGVYAPGSRLPGALQLARMYGVSTVTSNRALAELAEQGLVERRSRQGTFVPKPEQNLQTLLLPVSEKWCYESPRILSYLSGVLGEAAESGIHVHMEHLDSPMLRNAESIRKLKCQGVIQLGKPDLGVPLNNIRELHLPCVSVGVDDGDMGDCFVTEDFRWGAMQLVRAMRRACGNRIGLIANLGRTNHRICRKGYEDAMRDTQLGATLVRDADMDSVADVARELYGQASPLDGLVIAGSMHIRALAAIREMDNKLLLGGFGESPVMLCLKDFVCLVEFDLVEVGKCSVRILRDLVQGELAPERLTLLKPLISLPSFLHMDKES